MNNVAFLFPGQGAQYVGMGKSFFDKEPIARDTYQMASELTGIDVNSICFEDNLLIHRTEYTQLAMLTTELAIWKVLCERGYHASVFAGLSLGEYAALVACGGLAEQDAYPIIRKRGILMQEAVPSGGGMTAILGLDGEEVKRICEQTDGNVSVANYNCPGQVVITGDKTAVDLASEHLVQAGAKRAIPLQVSGPFHSSLLSGAATSLYEELNGVTVHDLVAPYVANTTAMYVQDKNMVKELLKRQIQESVLFEQSIRRMIQEGIRTFVEIGPGSTLCGFIRRIDKEVLAINIDHYDDMQKLSVL